VFEVSLHIHALVVTEVFTTASLGTDFTDTKELPVSIITSLNTWSICMGVKFVSAAWSLLVGVNSFVFEFSNADHSRVQSTVTLSGCCSRKSYCMR
jgi:hypothetical protein